MPGRGGERGLERGANANAAAQRACNASPARRCCFRLFDAPHSGGLAAAWTYLSLSRRLAAAKSHHRHASHRHAPTTHAPFPQRTKHHETCAHPASARSSATNGAAPAAGDATGALPVVKIDNRSDAFATIVSVEFGDRLGELLDTVRGLRGFPSAAGCCSGTPAAVGCKLGWLCVLAASLSSHSAAQRHDLHHVNPNHKHNLYPHTTHTLPPPTHPLLHPSATHRSPRSRTSASTSAARSSRPARRPTRSTSPTPPRARRSRARRRSRRSA